MCVCVHSYVRACLCLRACDGMWLLLNLIPGRPFTMFSISLYDDIRRKEASQKEEFANSLYLSNTF